VLSGTVPWTVTALLPLVRNFSLADNQLSGSFPDLASGAASHIKCLNLSNNNFVGMYPSNVLYGTAPAKGVVYDMSSNCFDGGCDDKCDNFCGGQQDDCNLQPQFAASYCLSPNGTAPSPPSSVDASAGVSLVNVSWPLPPPSRPSVSHYVVMVFDTALQNIFNVSTVDASRELVVTNVTNGRSYFVKVVSVNVAHVSSEPSAPSRTVTPCATSSGSPPDAPTSVSVAPFLDGVEVTWTPSPMTPCWVDAINAWNVTYELVQSSGVRTISEMRDASTTWLVIANLSRASGDSIATVLVRRLLLCASLP
jgi:hypothetical protein